MGEDPRRPALTATPGRVVRAFAELTDQGGVELAELLDVALFEERAEDLVLVRDIEFYSLCEHHLLPFLGRCHVAYLPAGRLIGFSRIPRLVDHFARRLQVQERLTRQIADALDASLNPRGVACVVEALHLCMAMRGVRKQQAAAVTTAYRGLFRREPARRAEIAALLRGAERPGPLRASS